MGVENTVVAGIQRRRHLSSKVFYRYKSASREIVYHRKSVSKLILLLSPIKCHFAQQCFSSSSVILKRISIGTTTTTTTTRTNIFSIIQKLYRNEMIES